MATGVRAITAGWVVAITLAGLALRIAAARGGLWLDEAWSASFAADVATPAAVFLGINHDNNHHLNSLWLQWVGADASPVVQRALSILSGTATIPVAAAIAGRRGRAAAIVAAVAFALSPFLVTYGAEARGYAPMLCAWTVAIGIADRFLERPAEPPRATAMALAALLGCMAQATMAFGLGALGLWVLIARIRAAGVPSGVIGTARLFAPAAVLTLGFAVLVWAAADAAGGLRFGNREAHDWLRWMQAMVQLWDYGLGVAALVLLLVALGATSRDRLGGLALGAGVGLPLLVALAALPNSGAARYYAVAVPPVLLWAAVLLPRAAMRPAAAIVAISFLTASIVRDGQLVANLRGDPDRPVRAMIAAAPGGTNTSLEQERSGAILIAAARTHGYALAIAPPCPAAAFHFVERDGDAAFPAQPAVCGHAYGEVTRGDPSGLSGTHWRLYARR
ncbi:hypothetical protein [Sphingomonas sp. VNH70]|uniref:hypothetical protein n=1 Tax=Sphingomonas silueang TaxID=3156617 RepID=UPI0032B6064F